MRSLWARVFGFPFPPWMEVKRGWKRLVIRLEKDEMKEKIIVVVFREGDKECTISINLLCKASLSILKSVLTSKFLLCIYTHTLMKVNKVEQKLKTDKTLLSFGQCYSATVLYIVSGRAQGF